MSPLRNPHFPVQAGQVREHTRFVCIPFWKANLLPSLGRRSAFGRKKRAGEQVAE